MENEREFICDLHLRMENDGHSTAKIKFCGSGAEKLITLAAVFEALQIPTDAVGIMAVVSAFEAYAAMEKTKEQPAEAVN